MKKSTRVQLELPQSAFDRLNSLKDRTEATSYTEVIKRALQLQEAIMTKQAQGQTLFSRDADGNITEFALL
jgi:hypothetical protein